jgi:hypothetical protein
MSAQRMADLRGQVVRAMDTVAVVGAEVDLLGAGRTERTNSSGSFVFRRVSVGRHRIRVRQLGYSPVIDSIDVKPFDTTEHRLVIPQLPTTLAPVSILGSSASTSARYGEAYRRAAMSRGYFFKAEEIQRLNPWRLESLLFRVPGARVTGGRLSFARCQDGRSADQIQLWIDGYRMTGRGHGVAAAEALELLHELNPAAVQIMEVYTGVSNIPAEFLDDACAVIAIWTKSR